MKACQVAMSLAVATGWLAVSSRAAETELRPVVDRVFPFERALDALHLMKGGSYFGKICITIAD